MAEKEQAQKDRISPTTVAWLLLGGGVLLVGWKLLDTLSAGQKAAEELSRSIMKEADEARLYVDSGAYSDEGLDIRSESLSDKIVALKIMSENWFSRTLKQLGDSLKSLGIYVVWPAVTLIGAYIVYSLVKNRPKQPPRFRCSIDGLEFSTEEELARHNESAHQGSDNVANIRTAQSMFLAYPNLVQEAVALQYISPAKVQGDWSLLSPLEIIGLKTAIEIVIGYGIGVTMQTLIPYLVII